MRDSWTTNKNVIFSGVVTCMCLSILIVSYCLPSWVISSLLEIKNDLETSMTMLSYIGPYSREAIFGKHSCIFCKSYLMYLKKMSRKKHREWVQYYSKLRSWFDQSFQ